MSLIKDYKSKNKKMDFSFSFMRKKNQPGFTLVEILVGGTIMTIVVIATLTLYMRSNKMAVDQQQFAEVQQDVRASMFFLSRDARSAGVGLTPDIAGYFLEGKDSFGPAPEYSDSLRVLGNFDNPLELIIEKYQGGSSGGAATAFLYQWSLENSPYQCPEFFENRVVLVISTRCPGCFTYRYIPNNSVFGCGTGEEHVNFQPGQSELNPPGGLVDTGCAADCWDDAIITLGQIRHFWVDTTGNPGDYPEFTAYLTPDRGYVVDENGNGVPNVLYMTTIDEETQAGRMIHLPLAQNIENLQIEYNGDYLNDDNMLDGFIEWQPNWTGDLAVIPKITQIRVWILGKTARPYVSFSGTPPANIHLYRRPTISNSLGETNDDMHRRFLLESTVTVRNMALNIYNTGAR